MARRNKHTMRREENRKQREEHTKKFQPVDTSGLDRHGDGFDVVVSDDDPEVAADLAAKTAEPEAAAAKAVAGMQTAQTAPEPESGSEHEPGSEPGSEPETGTEPESEPESAPVKKKARPAQDPEPTPMPGVVTEPPAPEPESEPEPTPAPAPEPEPAPAPKKASAPKPAPQPQPAVAPARQGGFVPEPPGWFTDEPLDEEIEKFAQEEIEAGRMLDFDEFCAEQDARLIHALRKVRYAEYVRRLYQKAEEAKKWRTILVVKGDDGKWQFLVDAWKAATKAIDLVPGIDAKMKALMKDAATEDLYQRAEARQRHSETGEVLRYESRDLADLKKQEWRQAYDADQAKKNKPAGKPA